MDSRKIGMTADKSGDGSISVIIESFRLHSLDFVPGSAIFCLDDFNNRTYMNAQGKIDGHDADLVALDRR